MLDGMQRDIARHAQQSRASDSTAFPRPGSRPFVTAADGGTMGLHRPGARIAAGGHAGDAALRDSLADESERARDLYIHQISNAWKKRDEWPQEADDDAETEARAGAIRNALLSRGASPDDVEDYLSNCDDDDLLDNDVGYHVAAFEGSQNGRDAKTVADDRKRRLDAIYAARDAELANEWRKGKPELNDLDIGEQVAAFEQSLNGRDAQAVAAARKRRLDALYQQRDHELANEWRKGK
jgi:hypothetical protein